MSEPLSHIALTRWCVPAMLCRQGFEAGILVVGSVYNKRVMAFLVAYFSQHYLHSHLNSSVLG